MEDLVIKYRADGKLESASNSSFFAESQNDRKIVIKFSEDLGDFPVFASFRLPYPQITAMYGNYKAQSLLLTKKVDEKGGYVYEATIPSSYLDIPTSNNKAYINAVVQSSNGVEEVVGTNTILVNGITYNISINQSGNLALTSGDDVINATLNAISIDNKIYKVKEFDKETLKVVLVSGFVVKTYQMIEFKILDASGNYNVLPVLHSQFDILADAIATNASKILDLETNKQDKVDENIEFADGIVVDALNDLNTRVIDNTSNIEDLDGRVATNTSDIETLKLAKTGLEYIGELQTQEHIATNEQLSSLVYQKKGRFAESGDLIINYVNYASQTDEIYMCIASVGATTTSWAKFPIQFLQSATNTAKGIIKGKIVNPSDVGENQYKMSVDIQDGEINDIKITWRDTSINPGTTTSNIEFMYYLLNNIAYGKLAVPKARADKDGNQIDTTYMKKTDGATKDYVRAYASPKELYTIYYADYIGEQLKDANVEDGYTKEVVSSAIGYTKIADLTKELTTDVVLGNQNGCVNDIWVSASTNEDNIKIRIKTSYKKADDTQYIELGSAVSEAFRLNVGSVKLVEIKTTFDNLQEALTLELGDTIKQTIEIWREVSAENTFTFASNTSYPATFLMDKIGIVNYYLSKIISGLDLAVGEVNATYDTQDGITLHSQGKITFENEDEQFIQVQQEMPIISSDEIIFDATEDNQHINAHLHQDITNKLARALLTPMSTPTENKIVSVDTSNSETLLGLGDGLAIEDGKLKATATGGGNVDDVQIDGVSILDQETKIANIETTTPTTMDLQECETIAIDSVVQADSHNLIESGAVYSAIQNVSADFIVENGTSGDWTYRKWNSGLVECFIRTSYSDVCNATWGSLYNTNSFSPVVDYPITFTEMPKEYVNGYNSQGAGGWVQTQTQHTQTQCGSFKWIRPTSFGTSATYYFDIQVVGKWK